MRPARHLDPQPVATAEAVGGRPEVDGHPLRSSAGAPEPPRPQPGQPVADVHRAPRGLDVADAHEEVGVLAARAHVEIGGHRPDDLEIPVEGGAGVDEHVGARLEPAVVPGTGVGAEDDPADRGGRVRRVVVVAIGRRDRRRMGGEAAAAVEVPAGRRRRRRPVGEVPPPARAHDEDPHRRLAQPVGPAPEVGVEPGQRLAQPDAEHRGVGMGPGTDGELRMQARRPHRGVVGELPRQEEVVPAAEQAHRRDHLGEPRAVVDATPVGILDVDVFQPVLVETDAPPDQGAVEVHERKACEHRREGASLADHGGEHPQRSPLLVVDGVHPAEHRVERERAVGVDEAAELRGGDLRRERLQPGGRARGDRPLHEAEIAGAGHGDAAPEPGLLLEPRQGVLAVLRLVAEGIEVALRAERPARALHHDLVAPLGEGARDRPHVPPAPVRAADQDDVRGRGVARMQAVGEEHDAVAHRDPEVGLDGDVLGFGGRKTAEAGEQTRADGHGRPMLPDTRDRAASPS